VLDSLLHGPRHSSSRQQPPLSLGVLSAVAVVHLSRGAVVAPKLRGIVDRRVGRRPWTPPCFWSRQPRKCTSACRSGHSRLWGSASFFGVQQFSGLVMRYSLSCCNFPRCRWRIQKKVRNVPSPGDLRCTRVGLGSLYHG
jgi:hypothetical protein